MKTCKYKFINNSDHTDSYSYQEVINLLKNSPELFGILYNKTAEQKNFGKQGETIDKIQALKEAGLARYRDGKGLKQSYSFMEDSADLKVDDNDFTVQTFIDSNFYIDKNGNPLMHVFNNEEWIERQRLLYANQKMDPNEIEQRINILKDKGQKIAKNSYDLHKIILKERGSTNTEYTLEDTEEATKGTVFEHLAEEIHTKVAGRIYGEVRKKNGVSKEYGDDSEVRIIKNVNIQAPISGLKGRNIHAHLDYVAIKPDGTLDIYLIKASHEAPSSWDKAKNEKYRNEMALMMQILEANGINTDNIRFNIIPVIMRYDEGYNNVDELTVDNAICYSHKNGGFILHEALTNARRFIEATSNPVNVDDSAFVNVNIQLGALFPEMDIKATGITQTAEEYIDKNWDYLIQGPQPNSGWIVTIDGTKYTIKSSEKGSKNRELVELIKKHQNELIDSETGEMSARNIGSKIVDGRRQGFCDLGDNYLNQFFGKYYHKTIESLEDDSEKYKYDWDIISNETLTRANIILFKHKRTHQLNMVMISPMNLKQKRQFGRNTNILGYHLPDMRAQDNQGHELLKATNGNIEIMRGLFLLNEILPSLGDVKLGEIEVVGNLGVDTHGLSYPVSLISPNFVKARKVLLDKEPNMKFENNFQSCQHISPVDLLIEEYGDILTQHPQLSSDFKSLRDIIYGTGYNPDGNESDDYDGLIHLASELPKDSLSTAKTTEIQIERLEELIEKVSTILKDKSGSSTSLSPDALIANSKSTTNTLIAACSKIMISASIALDRLSGIIRISSEDLSSIDSMFQRPQNMEDSQVRIVSKLLQDAIHMVSSKLDPMISDFNVTCLNYYEAKGYSKAQNFLIGNQSSVFSNLFQNSENELLFKNPYEQGNGLDEADRKFLKRALFIINKIRFIANDFEYKDENDPKLQKFIESHYDQYFFVPLEKASTSTQWSNPKKFFDDFQRRTVQYCKNPTMFFQEMYEGIMSDEERKQVTLDMQNLQTRNSFRASDVTKGRQRLLGKYGRDFFETNVQNIVIDYVFKHLQEQEMNKMLVRGRGILLYLKLTGQREDGDPKKFAKTIDHIDKYLTTSVFNRSIMEEDSKKFISRIAPLRKMVTSAYIAASPIAACRDTVGGFLSNMLRTFTKFRTDIDAKDVAWAYKYVLTNGVHTVMDIDLLDKMNAKYLISNINIEQQQEGYKTNTTGITNPGNIAYATLKKPDFLNRMVLFVAKLKHDGSINAYSVENGQLKYNWRMDERFNLLSDDSKIGTKEYNEQKSRKLSLIIALNNENPGLNLPVRVDTNIPDGYTNQEIEATKSLGDTIYGSYNKSTKAMYENMALGSQLGIFSTWMNGIFDVYFGKRRESSYLFEKRQAEDENGNLLYISEDGSITTEVTDSPYMKDIPLMVQGVMKTVFEDVLGDIILNQGKGLKDIWHDPMQRMNLRRAITDLLVALLLGLLFKQVFDPAYKEHKKNDNGNNIAGNAILEILYKGSSSCFDEFKGPLPILDYVTNDTNPATFQWLSKSTSDMYKWITGSKSLSDTILKSQALPKAFQDTYKMYQRENVNGISE